MTPRERVTRTLRHQSVDRAPRDLWHLPGIRMFRGDELDDVLARYPSDFAVPDFSYGRGDRVSGTPGEVGIWTDAWGCTWHVGEPGVIGEVKEPPLADAAAIDAFRPPFEVLENADLSRVDAACAATNRFVRAGTDVRPFERVQFLRGTEQVMMDLALGAPELRRLLEMLHAYNRRELEMWSATDVDGVAFLDDWGTQQALLISPAMWRETFKPMYREYVDILHAAGKFAFFHSDGHISEIYPDLIEIGVDAVNSQLFCMDIEELGDLHRGRITFWGEIDRQRVLPFGTLDEVRDAVRRVRRALDRGSGGVIAQCEWGLDVARDRVEAVFAEWDRPLAEIASGT